VTNRFPITIRNGTLKNFDVGVWAETAQAAPLNHINVDNMTIFATTPAPNGNSAGIVFGGFIDSSTVSGCALYDSIIGIQDIDSNGGNSYTNITFTEVYYQLFILPYGPATVVLSECHVKPPAN
jgi:hypothetical protein